MYPHPPRNKISDLRLFSSRFSQNTGYYGERVNEQPEDVLMELIARFGQTIMRARDDMEK